MDFVDWFLTVDFVALAPIQKLFKKWLDAGGYKYVKGLHVIGTCGECKNSLKEGAHCNYWNIDSESYVDDAYGCIDWKKKDV